MTAPELRQMIEAAVQLHRAGELRQAETLYRRILAFDPNHPDALHMLGLLAAQAGQLDQAASLVGRAVEVAPHAGEFCGTLGQIFQRLGRIADAETTLRRGIELDPANPKLHNNLGGVLASQRRFADAEAAYRTALSLSGGMIEASLNLGALLAEQGKHERAIAAFKAVIAQRPTIPEAFNNLAASLLARGAVAESLAAADEALRLRPDYPQAHSTRAGALRQLGRAEQAAASYEAALRLDPGNVEWRNLYAVTLHELGRSSDAIEHYRRAIGLRGDYLDPRLNLADALEATGRSEQAIDELRAAIDACPNPVGAYNNLGVVYLNLSRLGDAIDAFGEALKLDPASAEVHNNHANALCKQGRLDEAIESYRAALRARPGYAAAHSNLLLSLHFDDRASPKERFEAHLEWARTHAESLAARNPPPGNPSHPDKRLKVGYVSADLKLHPVGRFLQPLLEARDRERFEVICYSDAGPGDALTRNLKALSDGWRDTAAMSDQVLADLIRRDGIDLLVDLAGHTAMNRLLVFARGPAPVQLSFLGYPDTTGMRAMGWRIVDSISDPPGVGDEFHTERLIRLDAPFVCYRHPPGIEIGPPPVQRNGFVTFGSFNNLSKLSPRTMRTWARLMLAVPTARLVIKALALGDEATQRVVRQALARNGLPIDRVELLPPERLFLDHLRAYSRIDIALDTFPYNGTTTTCEALAMGVPVIALAGESHAARMGASILSRVELQALIAADEGAYVQIAAALAADIPRIVELRKTLSERLTASPLCDAGRVAAAIEGAFRLAWRQWCATPRA